MPSILPVLRQGTPTLFGSFYSHDDKFADLQLKVHLPHKNLRVNWNSQVHSLRVSLRLRHTHHGVVGNTLFLRAITGWLPPSFYELNETASSKARTTLDLAMTDAAQASAIALSLENLLSNNFAVIPDTHRGALD